MKFREKKLRACNRENWHLFARSAYFIKIDGLNSEKYWNITNSCTLSYIIGFVSSSALSERKKKHAINNTRFIWFHWAYFKNGILQHRHVQTNTKMDIDRILWRNKVVFYFRKPQKRRKSHWSKNNYECRSLRKKHFHFKKKSVFLFLKNEMHFEAKLRGVRYQFEICSKIQSVVNNNIMQTAFFWINMCECPIS